MFHGAKTASFQEPFVKNVDLVSFLKGFSTAEQYLGNRNLGIKQYRHMEFCQSEYRHMEFCQFHFWHTVFWQCMQIGISILKLELKQIIVLITTPSRLSWLLTSIVYHTHLKLIIFFITCHQNRFNFGHTNAVNTLPI